MNFLKLNNELIEPILSKRPGACTKEEMMAILKLFGFQVKEWRAEALKDQREGQQNIHFEIHHRVQFVIEISAESDVKAVTYDNDWCMDNGFVMVTDTVADLILVVLNMLVPRLQIDFDGPMYDHRNDYEYENQDEMQGLLTCAQAYMNKLHPKTKKEKVDITLMKVEDVIKGIVDKLTVGKIRILMDAVNDREGDTPYNFIKLDTGAELELDVESRDKNVLEWSDFLQKDVNVGNFSL